MYIPYYIRISYMMGTLPDRIVSFFFSLDPLFHVHTLLDFNTRSIGTRRRYKEGGRKCERERDREEGEGEGDACV